MPLILFAAESYHADGAVEMALLGSRSIKGDLHGMRILLIFIDDHQGPLFVGSQNGVGGDEIISDEVLDVAGGREDLMLTATWLDPFKVDQLSGKELGIGLLDLIVGSDREHAEGAGRCATAGARHFLGSVMEIIDGFAACFEKSPDIVDPPECGEDVDEGLVRARSDVGFSDEHGNARRETVVTPHLKDV